MAEAPNNPELPPAPAPQQEGMGTTLLWSALIPALLALPLVGWVAGAAVGEALLGEAIGSSVGAGLGIGCGMALAGWLIYYGNDKPLCRWGCQSMICAVLGGALAPAVKRVTGASVLQWLLRWFE